jgi:hypothetical protein
MLPTKASESRGHPAQQVHLRQHLPSKRVPGTYDLRLTRRALRPNPSFKPTRYGRQRKPGLRHLVHHLSPGLRCLPLRAA